MALGPTSGAPLGTGAHAELLHPCARGAHTTLLTSTHHYLEPHSIFPILSFQWLTPLCGSTLQLAVHGHTWLGGTRSPLSIQRFLSSHVGPHRCDGSMLRWLHAYALADFESGPARAPP